VCSSDLDSGSSRGFHVAGCWFGIDPGTGADAGAEVMLTMFRHRDRGSLTPTTRRPSNKTDPDDEGVLHEGASIGVAPGSTNPRAQFNVFGADVDEISIGAEAIRMRISGNQFFSPFEIGRGSDTQVPSMIYGTDGDGVNDADEGNLFLAPIAVYGTQAKVYVVAGNVFGLARDGSRVGTMQTIDSIGLNGGTMIRFGSDFNGVSDALEANKVYDGLFPNNNSGNASINGSWYSLRGNQLVNCLTPPIDGSALTYFDKFMDASVTAKPVIAPASTVSLLTGTCSSNKAPYTRVYLDLSF